LTNPSAIKTITHNSIFTNVALTDDGDVWWEGLTKEKPKHLIDWRGQEWTPESKTPAAHPNSRFTAPINQCPVADPNWADLNGVPISAIIFGGRRSETVPLVYQAFNWDHGTYIGASVCSEGTAAAENALGVIRNDPFAMLPFCGYNFGDYFKHWFSMASKTHQSKLPKIFHVNWFRKEDGKFLWPGYGDNSRVLKWIFERVEGSDNFEESAIGYLPKKIDTQGLQITPETMKKLLTVDKSKFLIDVKNMREYLTQFADKVPQQMNDQIDNLITRLQKN